MDKKKLLKAVNAMLALTALGLAGSGLAQGLFGYPIPYEVFRVGHPIAGYAVVGLLALHLWLNWGWVRSNYFPRAKKD